MSVPEPWSNPEMWIEHRDFVRALARRLLADEHAAEDVAQEACIAALESPPRSSEAARAWLSRVVRNLSLNTLRERERRSRRELSIAREEAHESNIDARIDAQRRVLEAVTALREPYKTAIWMRWFEGLPPREIARRTQVPIETAKSRLKRGLAELQVALERDFGDRERWMHALAPLAIVERTLVGMSTWVLAGAVTFAIVSTWAVSALSSSKSAFYVHENRVIPNFERGSTATSEAPPDTRLSIHRESETSAAATSLPIHASSGATTDGMPMAPQGPAFELELELPNGLISAEFSGALVLDGAAGGVEKKQFAPVVADPSPRVRFAREPRTSLFGGGARSTWTLTLTSLDGLWRGERRLPAIIENEPTRVRILLEPRAIVEGRVRDRAGKPVAAARVRLRTANGTLVDELTTDGDGRWSSMGLVLERLTIEARSIAHPLATTTVELLALERKELEIVLESCATTTLTGRLTSRTGSHVPSGAVRVASGDDPTFVTLAEMTPAFDSRDGVYSFAIESLAPGTYTIYPPMDDGFAWSPAYVTSTVPSLPIVFTCRDDVEARDVALRARRADDGSALKNLRATILLDRYGAGRKQAIAIEPRVLLDETSTGEALFRNIPSDMRGWWLVEADGCASAWGELSALTRSNGRSETTAALEAGWTARFWIGTRDEFGREIGIENARIVTRGGTCLATSSEDGIAYLDLLYDPGRLRVELPGWRMVTMEGFANGKLASRRVSHRVWLERQ